MKVYNIDKDDHKIRILDTQGFGCPKYPDAKLYNSMCLNFFDPEVKARVHEDGLNSIIIPFMVPRGGRVNDELIKVLYNHIMMF